MLWLLDRFALDPVRVAFIHRDRRVTYGEMIAQINSYGELLARHDVPRGNRVVLLGDYSPELFCMMLALALNGNIVIPLSRDAVVEKDGALSISGCEWQVEFDQAGLDATITRHHVPAEHMLLDKLRADDLAGLLLFSSGSTGRPKAILHDFERVAGKFFERRTSIIAIPFLMIDHFGGVNTILGIVSSLGTVVTVADRSVDGICQAIERYSVELLPTTPSFLTMLMASQQNRNYDLSSLKRITYGTEVMPQNTLDRVHGAFPGVTLQQTYGLSELGVMQSKSRDDGSLWVRIGGSGFKTKVIDNILWIRSDFAMLGYLNAPSEFDEEGWFNTQDRVEVDGEYFRILGRVTDLINIGGQKVYPAEVEDAILGLDNVVDVTVFGEPHELLGNIVVAKVAVEAPEGAAELKRRIRSACSEILAKYKIPSKVIVAGGPLHTARQKKQRSGVTS